MAITRAGSGQVKANLKFEGTTGIILPVGNTSARNPTPVAGEIRYNSQLSVFEGYTGSTWGTMGPYPFLSVNYFTGDGATSQFTCNFTITNADNVIVTVNGVQLRKTIDWQLVGTTIINFTESDGNVNPPGDGADITVRSFSPLNSVSIPTGSVTAQSLSASNSGTTGQVLSLDNTGSLKYISIPAQDPVMGGDLTGTASNAQIGSRKVGIAQLNVTDGSYGQVLATDGVGNLTFITPTVTNTNVLFSSLKLTPLAGAPSVPNGTIERADGIKWNPAVKRGTKS
jgi:hypothetical protein